MALTFYQVVSLVLNADIDHVLAESSELKEWDQYQFQGGIRIDS